MAGIDPDRIAVQAKAQSPLGLRILEREAEGTVHWVGAQFPTEAAAQDAGMSLRDYEDFVYGACLIGEPDPAKAWEALAGRQQKVVDWLKDKKILHITAPGIDFTVSVEGRTWMNDIGHQNMPAGEVFTGPVEDSAEGVVHFTYPAYYRDQEVIDVCLKFEHGKVVEASARSNQEFLDQMLDLDEGARRIGELAIGTNPGIQKFTKNTLFDEKIAGTFHMALGKSIPGTGGVNESGVHWDMVCNLRGGGEITADGQLLSKNGEFCI
jgi:aminopeptidase